MTDLNIYNNSLQNIGKAEILLELYNGLVKFVTEGKLAILEEKPDHEKRYNKIFKAKKIILALQGALDEEVDEKLVKNLNDFYDAMMMQLHVLSSSIKAEDFDACLKNLSKMRQAWREILDKSSDNNGYLNGHGNNMNNNLNNITI